jgi:hypothetical protein
MGGVSPQRNFEVGRPGWPPPKAPSKRLAPSKKKRDYVLARPQHDHPAASLQPGIAERYPIQEDPELRCDQKRSGKMMKPKEPPSPGRSTAMIVRIIPPHVGRRMESMATVLVPATATRAWYMLTGTVR